MTDFNSRQSAIFASLDDASKELKGTTLDQSESTYISHRYVAGPSSRTDLTRLRGKESIFKKPELSIQKCLTPRKVPDFEVNPHKWKKYSLADVDTSEHLNKLAVLDLLQSLDNNAAARNGKQRAGNLRRVHFKPTFNRASEVKRALNALAENEVADEEVDKPKYKGLKYVLPEYVIGDRSERRRRHKVKANSSDKCAKKSETHLKLPHLHEWEAELDDVDT